MSKDFNVKELFKEELQDYQDELEEIIRKNNEYNKKHNGMFKIYSQRNLQNKDAYISVSYDYQPRNIFEWPLNIQWNILKYFILIVLASIFFVITFKWWALIFIIPAAIFYILYILNFFYIFDLGVFSESVAVVKEVNQNQVSKFLSKIPLLPKGVKTIKLSITSPTKNNPDFEIREINANKFIVGREFYVMFDGNNNPISLVPLDEMEDDDEDDNSEE